MSVKLAMPLHFDTVRTDDDGVSSAAHRAGVGHRAADRSANLRLVVFEAYELKRNLPRDVAAYEAMIAARPPRPPPYDFGERRPAAALLSVREDRRAGVLV
jgi:hypothetical protein